MSKRELKELEKARKLFNRTQEYVIKLTCRSTKGYLAIPERYDKLLTSLKYSIYRRLNLKIDITSYDDLLDALRLSLKAYNFE